MANRQGCNEGDIKKMRVNFKKRKKTGTINDSQVVVKEIDSDFKTD